MGIHNGGSIKLWSDYFTNANVYAQILCVLIMSIKILIYTSSDAYDIEFFYNRFFNKNVKCDLLF